MKITKIDIPIYYDKLIVIQDKNWKKINKKYKIEAGKNAGAFYFRKVKKSGRVEYIVCFAKYLSAAIIAHESLHVVNALFNDKSIQLDPVNDEPQAYLLGWVVENITNNLNFD